MRSGMMAQGHHGSHGALSLNWELPLTQQLLILISTGLEVHVSGSSRRAASLFWES